MYMSVERELAALKKLLVKYRAQVAQDPALAKVISFYENRVVQLEKAAAFNASFNVAK